MKPRGDPSQLAPPHLASLNSQASFTLSHLPKLKPWCGLVTHLQNNNKMLHRTRGFLNHTRALSTEANAPKIQRIADELLSLDNFERYDFTLLWRLRMGLHRYGAPVAAAAPPSATPGSPAADANAAAAEKTAFDLKLEKYDAAAKIKIIKEVRAFTDLGLKEAKDLVEKVPCVLKKGLTKEEANPIIEKLKELGAAVVLE